MMSWAAEIPSLAPALPCFEPLLYRLELSLHAVPTELRSGRAARNTRLPAIWEPVGVRVPQPAPQPREAAGSRERDRESDVSLMRPLFLRPRRCASGSGACAS